MTILLPAWCTERTRLLPLGPGSRSISAPALVRYSVACLSKPPKATCWPDVESATHRTRASGRYTLRTAPLCVLCRLTISSPAMASLDASMEKLTPPVIAVQSILRRGSTCHGRIVTPARWRCQKILQISVCVDVPTARALRTRRCAGCAQPTRLPAPSCCSPSKACVLNTCWDSEMQCTGAAQVNDARLCTRRRDAACGSSSKVGSMPDFRRPPRAGPLTAVAAAAAPRSHEVLVPDD
mmetsp:Transcript_14553/g.44365  ORF Transcript_14553/g.44365 Transcript_14553/m.44365 type:complete len:239 (+) Transcript_14553:3281-3997(+)